MVVVASLWRGAMIERYSRAEHYIHRALVRLKQAGSSDREASVAAMSGSRLQALIDMLEADAVHGYRAPALASLKLLQERWDERTALSHGRAKVGSRSVSFRWVAAGKSDTKRVLTVKLDEMLARLSAMDDLQRSLGSQLGEYQRPD